MVPTILLDMPTNFVLGHLLIWLGRHELKGTSVWTRPLKLSWLYSALVFVPITAWFFYAYPAWSTVYLRPEDQIPGWSGPLIVSHYFLGMVFGTLLAQSLLRSNQTRWFFASLACGIFWLAAVWLLTLKEYFSLGTYAEFHAGLARPIFENPTFMMHLNVMGAVMAIPPAILGFLFYKSSRRATSKSGHSA